MSVIKGIIDKLDVDILRLIHRIEKLVFQTEIREKVQDDLQTMAQGFDLSVQTLGDRFNSFTSDPEIGYKQLLEKSTGLHEAVTGELSKVKALYDNTEVFLKEKKSEVEELFAVVTKTAFVGGYVERAASERKAADNYRWAAIAWMVVLALLTGYFFWLTYKDSISPGTAIFKAVVILVLSAPAAYFSRESNKHRSHENHFQQTALDIAGTPTYLTRLEKEHSDKILGELALRIFSRQPPNSRETQLDQEIKELLFKLVDRGPKNAS